MPLGAKLSLSALLFILILGFARAGVGEVQAAVATYSQDSKSAFEFVDSMAQSQGKEMFQKLRIYN